MVSLISNNAKFVNHLLLMFHIFLLNLYWYIKKETSGSNHAN